jgi:hypothetical protein
MRSGDFMGVEKAWNHGLVRVLGSELGNRSSQVLIETMKR